MSEPAFWVAPTWRRLDDDHPDLRYVAAHSWARKARARGASVEITAIHRYIESHIADVTVNGKRYVLGTVKIDGWHHVIAWLESEFSGTSRKPDPRRPR